MSGGLILFVGAIYLGAAVDLCLKEQFGLALAFIGYAIGNIGLYMVSK